MSQLVKRREENTIPFHSEWSFPIIGLRQKTPNNDWITFQTIKIMFDIKGNDHALNALFPHKQTYAHTSFAEAHASSMRVYCVFYSNVERGGGCMPYNNTKCVMRMWNMYVCVCLCVRALVLL